MIFYTLPQTGELEQSLWRASQRLTVGELFSLNTAHTFERSNWLGLLREDARIQEAEREAGTYDPLYGQFESDRALLGLPTGHAHALTEEEYKASEWYRTRPDGKPAIEYTPNMTPQRAQIYAEVYDRRRNEEQLIRQSSEGSVGRKALLFGSGLLASLPDPINFIPLAGALGKGASLGRKIARGAFEGAAGAALSDAVVFPVANQRGEDFGFFDVAMDITFGAVLGGGIAGIAGKVGQWRENRVNTEFDGTARDLQYAFEEAGLAPEDAARGAKEAVAALRELPEGLEAARELRKTLGGENRILAGDAMEKALLDVANGEPANVGGLTGRLLENLENSGILARGADGITVTRAALDYLILYDLREKLSPGTLARSERKLREEYNQTYLRIGDLDLTPSKRIKRGGEFFWEPWFK